MSAEIAPGGKLIAFESGRYPDRALEVVRSDGTRRRRIVTGGVYGHGGNTVGPRWASVPERHLSD